MNTKRKILYSPGYGAGWSSWASGYIAKFMLEYKPLIDYIEEGGKIEKYDSFDLFDKNGKIILDKIKNPILKQFASDCLEKFGEVPYMGGARDLKVATVYGKVKINDYDGSESIIEQNSDDGWM